MRVKCILRVTQSYAFLREDLTLPTHKRSTTKSKYAYTQSTDNATKSSWLLYQKSSTSFAITRQTTVKRNRR